MEKNEYLYKDRLLQPTNLMPRVTRQELCDNLDDILKRIDKENIGYVVTADGKKDLVLCPAHWFSYCFDERFDEIVMCAVYYALNNVGNVVGDEADFVRRHLPVMDYATLMKMSACIKESLEKPSGNPEQECWSQLLDGVDKQLTKYRAAVNREIPD